MGSNNTGGMAALFLGLVALSAFAAFPFLHQPPPPTPEVAEPDLPVEPAEAPPPPTPARAKAPPRKRVTNWEGGGETTVVSGSSRSTAGNARQGRVLNSASVSSSRVSGGVTRSYSGGC